VTDPVGSAIAHAERYLQQDDYLYPVLHRDEIRALVHAAKRADETDRLQQWVHDLQSGMYVNCIYCGHRFGPAAKVPATMADALKEHVERCDKHPMSALRARAEQLERELASVTAERDELRERLDLARRNLLAAP
jgi:hypothetical protein